MHDAVILEPDTLMAEGYIVGYDPCTTRPPYNIGEGLVLMTEQDTFLTYNFPEGIFNFPDEIFLNGYFFPPSYSDQYKVRFTFLKVPEDERIIPFCSFMIFFDFEITQNQIIIIKSESI